MTQVIAMTHSGCAYLAGDAMFAHRDSGKHFLHRKVFRTGSNLLVAALGHGPTFQYVMQVCRSPLPMAQDSVVQVLGDCWREYEGLFPSVKGSQTFLVLGRAGPRYRLVQWLWQKGRAPVVSDWVLGTQEWMAFGPERHDGKPNSKGVYYDAPASVLDPVVAKPGMGVEEVEASLAEALRASIAQGEVRNGVGATGLAEPMNGWCLRNDGAALPLGDRSLPSLCSAEPDELALSLELSRLNGQGGGAP